MLRPDITGILLAGGKSSRMGTEKGLVEFRGKPLIQYGIDLLSHYTDRIMISSGNPGYLPFGLELISDEVSGQGPAAGIAATLKRSTTPWSIVLACDLPFLEREFIDALFDIPIDYHAIVPIHDGNMEPLAALYHRNMGTVFEEEVANGNLALHKILQACHVNFFEADQLIKKYPNLFVNLNSRDKMNHFVI
ncbi:MAG: molybdenum cofactor guanylyltransferase [Prolixibacteraceae bacterium]|jgi:molybdopterin-guanine dinucleotide biosynthesis protein A|nr:molybdenum cofactor guanylyltransferase [Prolixibacteraceae bacterium]